MIRATSSARRCPTGGSTQTKRQASPALLPTTPDRGRCSARFLPYRFLSATRTDLVDHPITQRRRRVATRPPRPSSAKVAGVGVTPSTSASPTSAPDRSLDARP